MMLDKIKTSIENLSKEKEIQIDNFQLLVDSPEKEMGLYGSGMLIVNTPWQLKEKIQESVLFLEQNL